MSFSRDQAKGHRRALRAFAESEAKSDSDDEDGLDIIGSTRKGLDLPQYIDGLLRSLLVVDKLVLILHSSHSNSNAVTRC